jgi:Type IV secretion system pilin
MACSNSTGGLLHATNLPTTCADQSSLGHILSITFFVLGAVALLVVVIGGFRYIRAGSNETIVAEAKRQIAHALVGLIVALLGAVIVNFVLEKYRG